MSDAARRLHGNSAARKSAAKLRAELTAHVGGQPTATQRALIEQLCQLRLRLSVMDQRFVATGEQTDHDSRTYLAWCNSSSRLLRQLGLKGAPQREESLADFLVANYSAPTQEPAQPDRQAA